MAIEIVDFPINSMVVFHCFLLTFTRGLPNFPWLFIVDFPTIFHNLMVNPPTFQHLLCLQLRGPGHGSSGKLGDADRADRADRPRPVGRPGGFFVGDQAVFHRIG